jgi:hypothetical protein
MKKSILLAGLILMFCAGAAQASYIGAVSMEKRPFQFGVGGGASFVRSELNIGSDRKETSQTEFFGQFSFDVYGWQLDVGGGATDWDIEKAGIFLPTDMKSGMQPFVRAGIGGPIFRGQVLTIAPYLQASAYKGFEQNLVATAGTTTGTEKLEFDDIYEGIATLRLQVTIEGAHLYAGPAYFWRESEVKSTYNLTAPLATSGTTTTDVRARDFGGVAGVRWQLPTGWRLDLEGQWRDGITWSGALSYPF